MFSSGPNLSKLKTNLRLVVNRLKLLEKKKTEQALKARKEIADYIAATKEDRARIRVEHIVREDYMVEAMELIEMFCDLLLARFGLIESQKIIDPGLEEAIATLIWVTPRLVADVQEFKAISDQLTAKYGKEFSQACLANSLNNVNEKVMHKMSFKAPPKILVEKYLIEIAKSYSVSFEPDPTVMRQDEEYLGDLIHFSSDSSRPGGCATSEPPPAGFMIQDSMSSGGAVHPPNMFSPPNQMNTGAGSYPQQSSHFPPGSQAGMPFTLSNSDTNSQFKGFEPPPYSSGFFPDSAGALPNKNPNASCSNEKPDQSGFLNLPNVPFATPSNSCAPGSGSVNRATGGASSNSQNGDDVDFDDLSRRFEELKKRK